MSLAAIVQRQILASLKLGERLLCFARHYCDHQDRLGKGKIEKSEGGRQKEQSHGKPNGSFSSLDRPFYLHSVNRPGPSSPIIGWVK